MMTVRRIGWLHRSRFGCWRFTGCRSKQWPTPKVLQVTVICINYSLWNTITIWHKTIRYDKSTMQCSDCA